MLDKKCIAGVVLAGGKGARMGFRDKPLLSVRGKPLIEYVIEQARPQVAQLLISVNHNKAAYDYLGYPLVDDTQQAYAGPLLGIYSAMRWLSLQAPAGQYSHLACFAGDVPFFPAELISRLGQALVQESVQLAVSKSLGQVQPLFSLWSVELLATLQQAIAERLFGPKLVMSRIPHALVTFPAATAHEFSNINTPEDLAALERLLAAG